MQVSAAQSSIALGVTTQLTAIGQFSDGTTADISGDVAWQSGDTAIATVSLDGQVSGAAQGLGVFTASLSGLSSNDVPVAITDAQLTGIQVSGITSPLAIGFTTQLTAIGQFSDGTNADVTANVDWLSSDLTVASVDSTGVVNALAVGDTNIRATVGTVSSNVVAISVADATLISIQVSAVNSSIALGVTTQLTAIGEFSDGSTADISADVAWRSIDTSIASVSLDGDVSGVSQGLGLFSASFSGVNSNEVAVAIIDATLTRIQITPTKVSLPVGFTTSLTAMGEFSDGSILEISDFVNWLSSDPATLSVNDNGVVIAKAIGSTTLSANLGGVSSNALTIFVNEATLIGIQVTSTQSSIAKGLTTQLTAIGQFSDGTNADISGDVAWRSSDASLATVSASGEITGVASGLASFTASALGLTSNDVSVAITEATLVGIDITANPTSVSKGFNSQLTALGLFSDGSSLDISNFVTWLSSNTNIATIDKNGQLTGIAIGDVTVTATLEQIGSNQLLISVNEATLTDIQISAVDPSIAIGVTTELTAIGTLSDGKTYDISQYVVWQSSDPTIASVDADGIVTGNLAGDVSITAEVTAVAGVISNALAIAVSDAVLTEIIISSPVTELATGTSAQLTATGVFSDGNSYVITRFVSWLSSNTDTATIDGGGVITASGLGNVRVTAQLDGISSNALDILISEATLAAIQVTAASTQISKGLTTQLTATAVLSDGKKYDVTGAVIWRSSDGAVATIDDSGLLKGNNSGGASVTAELAGLTSNAVVISVSNAVLTGISVSADDTALAKGLSTQLTALGSFSDGSSVDITDIVTWSSSNSALATVARGGVLSAQAVGTVAVTASVDTLSSVPVSIRITDATLSEIQVTATQPSIAKGYTTQLTATAILSDGTSKVMSNTDVQWASSDGLIASIDGDGVLTGNNSGGVSVTAEVSGVQSEALLISVTSAALVSIQVTADESRLALGLTTSLTAIGYFSDESSTNISDSVLWAITDPTIAAISDTGVLTALAVGETTITASLGAIDSNDLALSVAEARLASLQITAANTTLANGFDTQMTAIAILSDGTQYNFTEAVTWYSSNSDVVTVIPGGEVISLSVGGTAISAELDGIFSNSVTISVTTAALVQVQISVEDSIIAEGLNTQLTAIGLFSDGLTFDITEYVEWNLLDVKLASISEQGVLTAKSSGRITLSASGRGLTSNTLTIQIVEAILTSIQVTSEETEISEGLKTQLTATGIFSNGTTYEVTDFVTWRSSNLNIATISENGVLSAIKVGDVTVTARYLGVTSNALPISVSDAVLQSIQASAKDNVLGNGFTTQLTALGVFSDGSTFDISDFVYWEVNDPSLANVDSNGLLTATGVGNVLVTAERFGYISNVINITISEAEVVAVQISAQQTTLIKGYSTQLNAQAIFSDDRSLNVTDLVSWKSDNIDVIQVTLTGEAVSAEAGVANIIASFAGIDSANLTLTVTEAELVEIKVKSDLAVIPRGLTTKLQATAILSDDSSYDISPFVSWVSSNVNIASVDADGTFNAKNVGNVSVTATIGAVSSVPYPLTVTRPELSRIHVTPEQRTVAKGYQVQLTATGIFTDGTSYEITPTVSWISSDTRVATVSREGLVSAIAEGGAVINANAAGISSNDALISVNNATLEELILQPELLVVPLTYSRFVTATGVLSDGRVYPVTQYVSWVQSDPNAFVIYGDGLITGLELSQSTVSAQINDLISSPITVIVTNPVLVGINVSQDDVLLAEEQVVRLTAIGVFSDGSTEDITNDIIWETADVSVVRTSFGVIRGIDPGTVTVVARAAGGVSSTPITVTVVPANDSVDKSALIEEQTLKQLGLEQGYLTNTSFAEVSAAVDSAQLVIDDPFAAQAEVDAALAALQAAIRKEQNFITLRSGTNILATISFNEETGTLNVISTGKLIDLGNLSNSDLYMTVTFTSAATGALQSELIRLNNADALEALLNGRRYQDGDSIVLSLSAGVQAMAVKVDGYIGNYTGETFFTGMPVPWRTVEFVMEQSSLRFVSGSQ
ncbi:beta strand repeat-containing protein [Thalassotalea maritima]|uniref:beta strand repeat-containing protein n=1 Tax=Thalassotalea maritima TaxID=3242416 RepID=UPI0035273DB4